MTTEEEKIEQIEEKEDDNNQYIEAIADLKKNSVSKEEYEKLKEENKKMLQAMIDGEQITIENPNDSNGDVNEQIKKLHKEMFGDDVQLSNLEYCTKALELRKLVMERDGEDADPFLPHSHNYLITDQDREASNRVDKELADAIEIANGSDKVFTATLQDKMVDICPQIRKKR